MSTELIPVFLIVGLMILRFGVPLLGILLLGKAAQHFHLAQS